MNGPSQRDIAGMSYVQLARSGALRRGTGIRKAKRDTSVCQKPNERLGSPDGRKRHHNRHSGDFGFASQAYTDSRSRHVNTP